MPAKVENVSFVFSLKLKTLLPLIVFLVFFPIFVFTLYKGIEERNLAEKQVEREIEQVLKLTDSQVNNLFGDINRTLILLSSVPEIKNGSNEVCSNFLDGVLKSYVQYVNFGVTDSEGKVVCSAVSVDRLVNLSDRTYFLDAKELRSFTVGSFRINRITNAPAVSFGYPILSDSREVDRVVFASLNTGWFEKLTEGNSTREDMSITIIDKNGTVLAREPEFEKWMGTYAAGEPLVKAVMAESQGTADLEGLDSSKRYYEFSPLVYGVGDNGYLAVGASKKEAIWKVDKIFIPALEVLFVSAFTLMILARRMGNSMKVIEDGPISEKV